VKLVRLFEVCLNETYSKLRSPCGERVVKFSSPKWSDIHRYFISSAFQLYFRAYYKVKENQVGLKLDGIHQLLVYADNVNLLGDNIATVKKNTESLIDANREVDLEMNAEKLSI
jgi:hypothetical protein